MTAQEILEIIEKYNLMVRRFPDKEIGLHEMRHHKEGNEIVTDGTRQFTREITIPKLAGYWMVQQSRNCLSNVAWNIITDHLAPTLEESIQLFLKGRV